MSSKRNGETRTCSRRMWTRLSSRVSTRQVKEGSTHDSRAAWAVGEPAPLTPGCRHMCRRTGGRQSAGMAMAMAMAAAPRVRHRPAAAAAAAPRVLTVAGRRAASTSTTSSRDPTGLPAMESSLGGSRRRREDRHSRCTPLSLFSRSCDRSVEGGCVSAEWHSNSGRRRVKAPPARPDPGGGRGIRVGPLFGELADLRQRGVSARAAFPRCRSCRS